MYLLGPALYKIGGYGYLIPQCRGGHCNPSYLDPPKLFMGHPVLAKQLSPISLSISRQDEDDSDEKYSLLVHEPMLGSIIQSMKIHSCASQIV